MTNKEVMRYKNIVADALNDYKWLHNGRKPHCMFMTLELYKIITNNRVFMSNTKIFGVDVKLLNEKGIKFFFVKEVYDLNIFDK